MKFKVKMHYSEYYYAEIEADNYEAALDKSKLIEMSECKKDEYTDWLVLDINEIKLSDSDLAFAAAYRHAVGSSSADMVMKWLHSKNHDKFYEENYEHYSSITDAYEIWLMAQDFCKKENAK